VQCIYIGCPTSPESKATKILFSSVSGCIIAVTVRELEGKEIVRKSKGEEEEEEGAPSG
jgi:hypothetical protein